MDNYDSAIQNAEKEKAEVDGYIKCQRGQLEQVFQTDPQLKRERENETDAAGTKAGQGDEEKAEGKKGMGAGADMDDASVA